MTLLPGRQSKPFAINDSGQISGEAILSPDNISGAVVWDGDVVMDLGGCCGGSATGLNNRGEVIANIYNSAGQYQAFLWDKTDGLRTIGTGNTFSSALLINDNGHVLLESFGKGLWLYEDGKLTQITLSPKYPSRPRYLGKDDVILGSAGPFIDEDHAFLWDRVQGYRDLNDMVPAGTGWELRSATAINSKGEIVGWGDLHGDENVGFLLTPIP